MNIHSHRSMGGGEGSHISKTLLMEQLEWLGGGPQPCTGIPTEAPLSDTQAGPEGSRPWSNSLTGINTTEDFERLPANLSRLCVPDLTP